MTNAQGIALFDLRKVLLNFIGLGVGWGLQYGPEREEKTENLQGQPWNLECLFAENKYPDWAKTAHVFSFNMSLMIFKKSNSICNIHSLI